MHDHRGFSLIELIVVIAVTVILAAVAVPGFSYLIVKAKEAMDIRYMNDIEYAIRLAHAHDPLVVITGFTVEVDPESGLVKDVRYTVDMGVDEDGKELSDREYSHTEGNDDNATPIIDWEYRFKAHETVTKNKNWKEIWHLKTDEPEQSPDPFE